MLLDDFKNKKLLLAVSGGIDSVYMYHEILKAKKKYSYDIGIAHINYNTSSVSHKSYLLCRDLAKSNQHPFYTRSVHLNTNDNFENNARNLRYSFFESIASHDEYDYILIAHTKDDLIETLYMRDGESNDFSSLPFNRSQYLYKRPMLNYERIQISKEVKIKKYKYYEDPTNLEIKYRRNEVRHEILPNLMERDKKVSKLLMSYRTNRERYKDFLYRYENSMKHYISFSNNRITIPKNILTSSSNYSMKLIVQASLKDYFNTFITKTHKFWIELYEIINSNKKDGIKYLSTDIILSFNKSDITIDKIDKNDICKKITHNTQWMNYKFKVSPYKDGRQNSTNKNMFICSESVYNNGLYVRKWINGDKYSISGDKNKHISKLFNENKLSQLERKQYPVITNGDSIKWIPGFAHSSNCFAESNKLISITVSR